MNFLLFAGGGMKSNKQIAAEFDRNITFLKRLTDSGKGLHIAINTVTAVNRLANRRTVNTDGGPFTVVKHYRSIVRAIAGNCWGDEGLQRWIISQPILGLMRG